ncbi:MAG: Fic family protein [Gammaproteobacteria bacterium]
MTPLRIFLSSVQKELGAERAALRDASVEVMLFRDPLEVWNPGALPPTLTLADLKGPHPSVPANPLIAEPMYLAKYIERMGTGIRDMVARCRDAGLAEPEFRAEGGLRVTTIRRRVPMEQPAPHVTPHEARPVPAPIAVLIRLLGASGEMSRSELLDHLGLKDRKHLRERYLAPAIAAGWVEMTVPDKPRHREQRYRLTVDGRGVLKMLGEQHGAGG